MLTSDYLWTDYLLVNSDERFIVNNKYSTENGEFPWALEIYNTAQFGLALISRAEEPQVKLASRST